MKKKIVADTGSDVYEMSEVEFTSAPMVLRLDDKEVIDTKDTNIPEFVDQMEACKTGRSSCPSAGTWLSAFEGCDEVYAVTISSQLSGSYNAAMTAKDMYLEENPDAKVTIVDSLSAGPHQRLITERLRDLISSGLSFETIEKKINDFRDHTHILFSLQTLENFAKNGRIPPAITKIASTLGIKVILTDHEGSVKLVKAVHGNKKIISSLYEAMKKYDYNGKKVYIGHCMNEKGAEAIKKLILNDFPQAIVSVYELGALCSFYAQRGGILVGFADTLAEE